VLLSSKKVQLVIKEKVKQSIASLFPLYIASVSLSFALETTDGAGQLL